MTRMIIGLVSQVSASIEVVDGDEKQPGAEYGVSSTRFNRYDCVGPRLERAQTWRRCRARHWYGVVGALGVVA
jgi:hypothetical protein